MVRAKSLRKLEPQTALLALFILVDICSVWIDSWLTLKHVTVDLAGLWAPVLMAICLYLAAATVFPHDEADHERLANYYRERKTFVFVMLIAVEMLTHVIYLPVFEKRIVEEPEAFWLWSVPYNLAIEATMVALIFVRSRRANVVLLVVLLLLLMVPYWDPGSFQKALARSYGYG